MPFDVSLHNNLLSIANFLKTITDAKLLNDSELYLSIHLQPIYLKPKNLNTSSKIQ